MDREDGTIELPWGSNCSRFSASHNHRCDQSGRSTQVLNCCKQSIFTTPVGAGNLEECSASCSSGCINRGTKNRKRKSRWDQPAETNSDSRFLNCKGPRIQCGLLQKSYSSPQSEIGEVVLEHGNGRSTEDKDCHACVHYLTPQNETKLADDGRQSIDEDVPPGFSPPRTGPLVLSSTSSPATDHQRGNVCCAKCPCEVVMGHPQERFFSRLSVSYGILFSVVQQFGSPQAETVESWVVAPGITFHPFPPLPPYPRGKKAPPTCAANPVTMNQSAEKR